jgi:HAMP domain-containing protein
MANEEKPRRRRNTAALTGAIVVLVVVVAIVLAYVAWRLITPPVTPIGDVLADLRTYDGQTVTVQGEVTSTLNVVLVKAFDLSDDTGTIKVITERGLPTIGDTLTVTGEVHEVFNVGGVNVTVLVEYPESP